MADDDKLLETVEIRPAVAESTKLDDAKTGRWPEVWRAGESLPGVEAPEPSSILKPATDASGSPAREGKADERGGSGGDRMNAESPLLTSSSSSFASTSPTPAALSSNGGKKSSSSIPAISWATFLIH